MKFIGLFVASGILLVIFASVFVNLLGDFALLALPAFFIAAVLRMYMSLDERLERIEKQLGIIPEEEPKSFAEQLEETGK